MSSKATAGSKRPRPSETATAGAGAMRAKTARGSPRTRGKVIKGKQSSSTAKKFDSKYDFEISSGEELDDEASVEAPVRDKAPVDEETADEKRRRLAREVISKYTETAKDEASDEEDDDDIHDAVGKKLLEAAMSKKSGAIIYAVSRKLGRMLADNTISSRFYACHKLSPTSVAVTGDGSRLFVGSKDCSITAWDVENTGETAAAALAFTFPGRRRTKADVLKQQRAAEKPRSGGYSGVKSVLSAGFGGGRTGGHPDSGLLSSPLPSLLHADGVSSIVLTRRAEGEGKDRAAMAKLRTVPDYDIEGHWAEVLAMTVTSDGKYLATAGKDRVIRIWDAASKTGGGACNLENFVGHKDTITGVTFRKDSHTLYSCAADRMVKLWNLDEMAYVDTLFGHQADILAIDAVGTKDRCVTAGRDRTVRLWKVPEATQLVFRAHTSDVTTDVVGAINDSWYVSGGADGSLSLWHTTRKKPVARRLAAHGDGFAPAAAGHDSGSEGTNGVSDGVTVADGNLPTSVAMSADDATRIAEQTGLQLDAVALSSGYCNWITALAVCPCADVIATGSGDGYIRFWRLVTSDRQVEAEEDGDSANADAEDEAAVLIGQAAQRPSAFRGIEEIGAVPVKGIVNALQFSADGTVLAAAVGQEHRLGRWWHYKKAKNGVLVVRVPSITTATA